LGRARATVITGGEWWRGRTDAREELFAIVQVVATVDVAKAAGVALAHCKDVDAALTVDALVMAAAAITDAIVLTSDPSDFERLATHFSKVTVLSV